MRSAANRTVLVTGATDGLGLAVARRLAAEGAVVLVHGRDPEKLERTITELRADGATEPHGYLADLSALDQVRELARNVAADRESLDVLVNNAGIALGERATNDADHELVFAVNYLSHFLLTVELLPPLRAGERSRIVNVSSLGQAPIDFDDVMLERGWTGSRSYSQSKLAQILFTIELAERLGDSPTVTALHPATYMDTNMVRQSGRQPLSTVNEGMEATVRLAIGDEVEGLTGAFFNGSEEAGAEAQAYDPEARRRLWQLSEELTGAKGP